MNLHRVAFIVVAYLFTANITHAQPPAGRTPPGFSIAQMQQIQAAADAAIEAFKRDIVTPQNARRMGFASVQEAQLAKLGDPSSEFFVRIDELRAYQSGGNANDLLKPGAELMYPVLVNNVPRSSISVGFAKQRWRATSFGAPNLARGIFTVRGTVANALSRAEKEFRIIRIPALKMVFLGHVESDALFLTPIKDNARLRFAKGQSLPADQVFTALVPAARAHDITRPG